MSNVLFNSFIICQHYLFFFISLFTILLWFVYLVLSLSAREMFTLNFFSLLHQYYHLIITFLFILWELCECLELISSFKGILMDAVYHNKADNWSSYAGRPICTLLSDERCLLYTEHVYYFSIYWIF